MTPIELFEEARLAEAIAAQEAVVRERPGDAAERLLLCELLAFASDRAAVGRHLNVLAQVPGLADYVAGWRQILTADDARHAGASPQFLFDPPDHIPPRIDAVAALAAGRVDEAMELLDAADETTAWLEGFIDGREFEGWRDADDLLAPVLEAFVGDQYVWIPLEQIRKLRVDPPEVLRDRIYHPARLWLTNGEAREVIVPALYAGTADHPEDGIRIGAGIDWVERDGLMRGLGSRTFLFGDEELTLDEFRQVEVRGVGL
jgi:type VI secretion system protein ImpE